MAAVQWFAKSQTQLMPLGTQAQGNDLFYKVLFMPVFFGAIRGWFFRSDHILQEPER